MLAQFFGMQSAKSAFLWKSNCWLASNVRCMLAWWTRAFKAFASNPPLQEELWRWAGLEKRAKPNAPLQTGNLDNALSGNDSGRQDAICKWLLVIVYYPVYFEFILFISFARLSTQLSHWLSIENKSIALFWCKSVNTMKKNLKCSAVESIVNPLDFTNQLVLHNLKEFI